MTRRIILPLLALAVSVLSAFAALPRPDHVVVVIMENHSYNQIIGNAQAPNINALAKAGALFVPDASDPTASRSGSHAVRHPSQPNYLELYAGSNEGTVQDGYPGSTSEPFASAPPFNAPNLGAQLLAKGLTFATFSESLPAVGSDVEAFSTDPAKTQYERKHNPAVNWQAKDAPANNHLPLDLNQPFFPLAGKANTGFPSDFSKLPTVSIVVPNQQSDMHDGSVAEGDTWLKKNIIDTYLVWAKTHNSLLIVTFDEDGDDTPSNLITTIFAGPMIKPGQYTELDLNLANPDVARTAPGLITPTGTAMNHWNVLATIEEMYGLSHIGSAAGRPAVTDVFAQVTSKGPPVVPNNLATVQGDTGNLFPLFSSKPIRYQQVYNASQFGAGAQTITSIAFRAHSPGIPFSGTVQQLQVNLSTTRRKPDALSSTFSQNVGANDTQVFNGPLQVAVNNSSTPGAVNTFDVVITFTTPFVYNPPKGNLLVDIRNLQGGTETPPLDQELDATSATGDAVSRVFNYGDASATAAGKTGSANENDSLGLVTLFGSTASPAPSPSPTPTPNTLLLNNSTRLITGSSDNVMIGGFIIGGNGKKKVVVRGIGPSLAVGKTPVAGRLMDPVIELHKSDGSVVMANDDWKETQRTEIQQTGLAPKDDRESAIVVSLDPGNYTVILSGKNGTSGIGLVEAYDVDEAAAARLLNLSTRGNVRTGDNVMIGGVIVGGNGYAHVIFRGLGPSLSFNGAPIPGTLQNPTLDLRDANGQQLAFDDNWKDSQRAEIEKSGLAPKDDREAAIIGFYPAGHYTAILRGKKDTTGIGLVEFYKLN